MNMKTQVHYITAMLVFAQYGLGALWGQILPTPILWVVGLFFIGISLIQMYAINTVEMIFIKYVIGFSYFYYVATLIIQMLIFQYREINFFNPYLMNSLLFIAIFAGVQLYLIVYEVKGYANHLEKGSNRHQTRFLVIPWLILINTFLYLPVINTPFWIIVITLGIISTVIVYVLKNHKLANYFIALKYMFPLMIIVFAGFYQMIFPVSNVMMFPITVVNYLHILFIVPLSVFILIFFWQYEVGKINPNRFKTRHYQRTTINDITSRNIKEVLPQRRKRY